MLIYSKGSHWPSVQLPNMYFIISIQSFLYKTNVLIVSFATVESNYSASYNLTPWQAINS